MRITRSINLAQWNLYLVGLTVYLLETRSTHEMCGRSRCDVRLTDNSQLRLVWSMILMAHLVNFIFIYFFMQYRVTFAFYFSFSIIYSKYKTTSLLCLQYRVHKKLSLGFSRRRSKKKKNNAEQNSNFSLLAKPLPKPWTLYFVQHSSLLNWVTVRCMAAARNHATLKAISEILNSNPWKYYHNQLNDNNKTHC